MNKKTLSLLLIALLAFSAMVALNLSMPRLPQRFVMPDVSRSSGYRLDPLTPSEEGVYEITIEQASGVRDAVLVLAAMRPFDLQINGATVYSYTGSSPYRRLHILPLNAGEGTLAIRLITRQNRLKVMLTHAGRAAFLSELFQNISSGMIGIYIAMLFLSLILYKYKRTEKYLLTVAAAVLIILLTALLTSGIVSFGLTERAYAAIQTVADAVRSPILIACCIILIRPPERMVWIQRHAMKLMVAAIATLMALSLLSLRLPGEIADYALNLLGLLYIAWSPDQEERPCRLFSVVCALRIALKAYTTLNNRNILPNSELMVYFYMPQLSCILILFGCMALVNIRFARKFEQVDALSVELERMNADLDRKVSERTADLEIQQQKRHMMMTNIFHDLRSPLFIVKGCADMLRVEGPGNEQCLNTMKKKLDDMSTMTEQLFLIAKLEDGKITFARVDVELEKICELLYSEYGVEARKQGISLRYEWDHSACVVTGDGFRLRQAFGNLIDNALHFCNPQKGEVVIRLSSAGEHVTLSVEDNGRGIAPEDLPHVFERYYTGHNSDKVRSTGLGLAIAHEIISAHEGAISVDSQPERGTKFTVCLPRARP